MPQPPFAIGFHGRVPPTTSPLDGMDPRIRGIGQSDLQPLVPSAQPNPGALQQIPFLALLIAINAPQGLLTFDPPDPLLAGPAYAQYVAAIPPIPSTAGPSRSAHERGRPQDKDNGVHFNLACRGGRGRGGAEEDILFSLRPTDPKQLTIQFGPPLSQEPQSLEKLTRSQLKEAMSGDFLPTHPADGPPSFLSLDSALPSGEQVSVYRGTLDGARPVVAKLYDSCHFDALIREVDAYGCLVSSSAVPKSLGVFGPLHRAWAALILEDKGKHLAERWQDLSLNDRIGVYGCAVDVHAAGVQHNDLECRNFIRDQDGSLYAIDFGHSTVGHCCMQETCSELGSLRQDLKLGVPLGALFKAGDYQGGGVSAWVV
ncbi:hypothetical protein B0H10DRAFT_2234757 [Mycena sp. CBHHK59/15]|nr:hypothetical protein B0H10DRAFT_2234757 [Mycena sp. CBHHK59/15]